MLQQRHAVSAVINQLPDRSLRKPFIHVRLCMPNDLPQQGSMLTQYGEQLVPGAVTLVNNRVGLHDKHTTVIEIDQWLSNGC